MAVGMLHRVATTRENNFNLLRMIAATGVLVSHAYPISLGDGAMEPLKSVLDGISLGGVSVYVFFAISGYFIAQSFERSSSLARFVMARVLRIFPGLAVVLLVTIGVAATFFTTAPASVFWPDAANYFARNVTLFFLQPDLPGVFSGNPYGPAINGSLWTLSYEVLCYAAVTMAGLAGLLRRRHVALAILGLCALAVTLSPLLPLHPRLGLLLDLGLPFAAGVAAYVWRDRIVLDWRILAALAVVAALAQDSPLFRAVFVIALAYGSFWFGCLQWPPLAAYRRFGDYSYGVYIYAFPVQQTVAAQGITDPLLNMVLAFPVTLACAVLSWRLVESPALRFKDVLGRSQVRSAEGSRP